MASQSELVRLLAEHLHQRNYEELVYTDKGLTLTQTELEILRWLADNNLKFQEAK